MKVKFGDLTVRQMYNICINQTGCDSRCPLFGLCDNEPWMSDLGKEIDFPDEEVKQDAEVH